MSAEREKQLAARLWLEGDWSKTGKIGDVEGRIKKTKRKILLFPLGYGENARTYFRG